jgi:hypothetical protein
VLEAELTSAVERIEKRLDWIEENLASIGRVSGRDFTHAREAIDNL